MATESIARFIRTQGGEYVNLDRVAVLRTWMVPASGEFNGVHGVTADFGAEWDVTLGNYDSEKDAQFALDRIMSQITHGQQPIIDAPARDFRTANAEVEE